MTQIIGILNVTRDSFSDGGRFLEPPAAIAHGCALARDGAAIVDVGAESSHPDAEDVPAAEELARLTPVIQGLLAAGVTISVDTYKPDVMRAVLELGATYINDITALSDPAAVAAVRDSTVRVILMHAVAPGARARRQNTDPAGLVGRIVEFFAERIAALERAGVARDRLILDPGMGFFLGDTPAPSLTVLRELPRIVALGLPVCVSVSRKSFLGGVLGDASGSVPVAERGAGTLAAELWAVTQGASFVRTHDVRSLAQGLRVWDALAARGSS